MMDEPRTTYETEWYGEPVTCCTWCSFVQGDDGFPNHTDWCDRDSRRPAASPSTGQPAAARPAAPPQEAEG